MSDVVTWGPALATLGLADEDWGPCHIGTYDELVEHWRGAVPVPSEADLTAALAIVASRQVLSDLRAERNRRLADSDKFVVIDRWAAYTATEQEAWAAYRQALRDLPETTEGQADPAWPVPPQH